VRQFTALHGALSESAACSALQLAGALVCSECALAGTRVAPAELHPKRLSKTDKEHANEDQ
jgi:hypothetical protein